MPGYIIDLDSSESISVDYWAITKMNQVIRCFLTHAHSDHTANLKSNWRGPKIICSKVNIKSIKI